MHIGIICTCTCVIGNTFSYGGDSQFIKVRCGDGDWICESILSTYIHAPFETSLTYKTHCKRYRCKTFWDYNPRSIILYYYTISYRFLYLQMSKIGCVNYTHFP